MELVLVLIVIAEIQRNYRKSQLVTNFKLFVMELQSPKVLLYFVEVVFKVTITTTTLKAHHPPYLINL